MDTVAPDGLPIRRLMTRKAYSEFIAILANMTYYGNVANFPTVNG